MRDRYLHKNAKTFRSRMLPVAWISTLPITPLGVWSAYLAWRQDSKAKFNVKKIKEIHKHRYFCFSTLFDKTSEKAALIRQNFCHKAFLTVLVDWNSCLMVFLIRQNFRKSGSYSTKFLSWGYSYCPYWLKHMIDGISYSTKLQKKRLLFDKISKFFLLSDEIA